MINVTNIISLTGRLAKDPMFYDNKDGSKNARAIIAVDRSESDGGACQFIHVGQYLPAGTGEGPWANLCKGCYVQLLGHLESKTYQKDGETVHSVVVAVDSMNYLETRAQTAARRLANAAAAEEHAS